MKRERGNPVDKIKTTQSKANESGNKKLKLNSLFLLLIVLLSFTAYYPTFDNEITSWDDEFYINQNPFLKELNKENLKTLFNTETYYMGNYHPLSMISLSIDYALGGENENGEIKPLMFHVTNLVLHILVSVLIFFLILLLIKNRNIAFFAALLFGIHTLHVESVAWISERKDVLYAFFFVASLISYILYIDKKNIVWYLFAVLLFLFSLFSKGQAVSLSVTIILIDWFKKRKLTDIKIILEKIPFLFLAVYFGIIAIGAQKESEALVDEQGYDLIQRIGIASFAFMQYVFKLILPINLAAIYPYPDIIHQTIPWYYYFMLLPVGLIIYLFINAVKRRKSILVFGTLFFVINIALLLQFIPVGSAVFADRYSYIPSIGFFIVLSVGIFWLTEKKEKLKKFIFVTFGLYSVFLFTLTILRSQIWQNSETLWTDTLEKSPNSVMAWNNLGSLRDKQAVKAMEENRVADAVNLREDAVKNFTKAIEGKPDYRNAFYNRGVSVFELGKIKQDTNLIISSIDDYNKAIAFDGQFTDAYHQRANAKAELGLLEEALKDYNLAIDLKSAQNSVENLVDYYSNRGITKGKLQDYDGAIADFNTALTNSPNEATVYSNRGRAKTLKGELKEAMVDFNKSIELNPSHYSAYLNRAVARQIMGDYEGAVQDYEKTTELNPTFADAYLSKGKLLIILNKKEEACNALNKAKSLKHPAAHMLIDAYCK